MASFLVLRPSPTLVSGPVEARVYDGDGDGLGDLFAEGSFGIFLVKSMPGDVYAPSGSPVTVLRLGENWAPIAVPPDDEPA